MTRTTQDGTRTIDPDNPAAQVPRTLPADLRASARRLAAKDLAFAELDRQRMLQAANILECLSNPDLWRPAGNPPSEPDPTSAPCTLAALLAKQIELGFGTVSRDSSYVYWKWPQHKLDVTCRSVVEKGERVTVFSAGNPVYNIGQQAQHTLGNALRAAAARKADAEAREIISKILAS